MKNPILKYELRYWLRSPMTYFLVGSMFAFTLVTMLGTGGYFDGPVTHAGPVSFLNSAHALTSNSFLFAKLLLFLVAIFFGFSIYRDYQHKMHHILYSYPLYKIQYLSGKYLSACITVSIAAIAVFLAIWIGELMLGTNNPKITDFQSSAYIIACLVYLLSTLLIIGTFVFIVVTLTRNIYAGFITVVCFVLLQVILENTLFNAPKLLALLDPFGQHAFHLTTKDWTFEIRNSSALPIGHLVLLNRLFWGVTALGSLYVFSLKFDFHYDKIIALGIRSSDKQKSSNLSSTPSLNQEVTQRFDFISKIKNVIHIAIFDLKYIVTSWLFILLSFFGIAAIFFLQLKVTNTGDFNVSPSTQLFIGVPLSMYTLIIIFSTFLFSGILIDRARTNKMHLMVDATPVKNWQLICSKISTILMMHILQLTLFLVVGVGIQLLNGYYNLELGLYFIQLFILTLPMLFVWNITSVFSHTILPNVFVSMFLLACLWLGAQSLGQVGIDTHLLKYNTQPYLSYSDLNGYGNQLKGYFLINRYWIAVAILLIPWIILFWKRGTSSSVSERFTILRQRFSPLIFLFLLAALILTGFGANSVYQAEQEYTESAFTSKEMNTALIEYKKNWEQYDKIVQPKITEINVELDIFPKQRRFTANGKHTLTNLSTYPIDTLIIRTGFDEITEIYWNGKAQEILIDEKMKCHLYRLDKSLLPGDTVSFSYTITNVGNTVLGRNSNILRNGTFLKQDIFPRLGYQFSENKHNDDEHGRHDHHFYHRDAQEVMLHTKISTSADQVAIAPGDLVMTEIKEGRKYFQYVTKTPQKMNFSFHSGDYCVIKDSINDVEIQVYHDMEHSDNVTSMLAGLKASLAYNSSFGTYPHKHIRIIEFPHTEESYAATLTGNNIPSSERLFTINNSAMEGKVDFPYYVMIHELTHEWFGNQLMAADAPGAKMLSESITEYITLCIYRKTLGEKTANVFLKTQFERYHRGKRKEKESEPPLYKVKAHQDYIAYGKGAIALHQISETIGEKKMNEVLRLFLEEYGRNHERYPNTMDFITLLKRKVDNSHHEVIDQWLMEIHDFDLDDIMN